MAHDIRERFDGNAIGGYFDRCRQRFYGSRSINTHMELALRSARRLFA